MTTTTAATIVSRNMREGFWRGPPANARRSTPATKIPDGSHASGWATIMAFPMAIFVGRDRELRALDEQLDAILAGEAKVVLVSGEPGVGKTRLVEELTRRAEARGFAVAWGRSWEEDGTPAYYPWVQVLRRLRSQFRSLFDEARAESSELGVLLNEDRGVTERDPAEARFRLFDASSELLRRAADARPIVVVLDDLHSADVATLQLLHFVARHAKRGTRLLVAGTLRDTHLHTPNEVTQLLAKIAREAVALPLGRLGREALVSWLESSAPDLVPASTGCCPSRRATRCSLESCWRPPRSAHLTSPSRHTPYRSGYARPSART